MKSTGGPAFPSHGSMGEVTQEGMTIRDYLAAKAMSSLILSGRLHELWEIEAERYIESLAEDAYMISDAMLAEREK